MTKARDVHDRLLASSPVNRQAARVLGGGVHYEPKIKAHHRSWDAPPVMRQVPKDAPALVGMVSGRLTVVGLLAETSAHQAAWVVRCTCGKYETRTAKAIRNPKNVGDRCYHCRHLEYLKHQDNRRQFGDRKAGEIQRAQRGG